MPFKKFNYTTDSGKFAYMNFEDFNCLELIEHFNIYIIDMITHKKNLRYSVLFHKKVMFARCITALHVLSLYRIFFFYKTWP